MSRNLYIYGGSFNPPHMGHVKVLETLCESISAADSEIIVLPSFRSPLKNFDYEPSADLRLGLIELTFSQFKNVKVDPYEINLNETAYTVDTLKYIKSTYSPENIYFVIGFDQLTQFHQWKDYQNILAEASLVVLPRDELNFSNWDILNEELLDLVESEVERKLVLKSGREIIFLQMEPVNMSSTEVRRMALKGDDITSMITEEASHFMDENNLYKPIRGKVSDYFEFSKICKNIIEEKNAVRVELYDVREIDQPSDFNLIASGLNTRHTKALSEYFVKEIKKKWGIHPVAVEGLSEGRWVVIDYGALIVHIFYDFVRNEYLLEDLWSNGTVIS